MRPGALHQTGTTNPDMVTSQPAISRSKCTTATMAKTVTAAAVNGFIVPRDWREAHSLSNLRD